MAITEPANRSIVNISSIEGFTGAAGLSAYGASKFAVRGMTKVAAQELAQFGTRVNSVHLGGAVDPLAPEHVAPLAGFACEDTLALATETIGFPARDTYGPE